MRKLMTFENFTMESFDDADKASNCGSTFFLYMFDQSPDNFSGEVRDADGRCIYTVDPKTMETGAMTTPDDVTSLRKHLIEKKKIKELDVIEIAQSAPVQTQNQTA